jgi:16S rRNA C967 or C1407 C5-methylase (RsmB/RsmF family)/NOL1/NOP2/fmu family ribosome biogenesis protein
MKTSTRLPKEFEQRMATMLGPEFAAFVESLDTASPVSVRVNPEKKFYMEGSPVPWSRHGFYLNERPVFTLDPSFHAGAYYVQEASSMLLEQALIQVADVNRSLRILDLSAAPGGKSTHLLSLISRDSLLVSNEVIRSRAFILYENIQKWGNSNVVVTNNDPQDFKRLEGFFDVIVVDAPCSGEGLFRKDPEAMQEWSVDNAALCAVRQRRILSDVLPALKENGVIIYSTCTYNEAENESNLAWLSTEFDIEFVSLTLNPQWGVKEIQKESAIGYQCYPHKVTGEGFFISVMRKKSATSAARVRFRTKFTLTSKKINEQLVSWLKPNQSFKLIQQDNLVIALHDEQFNDIQYVADNLSIVSKGTALAELKHEKAIPDHAAALCIHLQKENFTQIELTEQQALLYLRKDNLTLETTQRGFALITYKGNNLGWVNLLGNRVNNLYPSNWRIRMGA